MKSFFLTIKSLTISVILSNYMYNEYYKKFNKGI